MPAAPMYGRLPIVKMLLVTIALTVVISAVMVPINWNGQGASTAAPKIDHLLNVMIVLSAFVFSLVMVMLFYALWKFKAKPGDESDGEPIHGNTRLEIAWTLIPTVIVLFAGGYSWKVLDEIEDKDPNHLTVSVFSQQYAWSFAYPGKEYAWSEGELHVPVNRQVQFKMHAMDVIHSFWVPEWRIKKDNVPGITTSAIVTPDKVGTYQLVCTELCGFGHATMRAKVVVESPAKFNEWVEGLDQQLPEPFMDVLKEESVTNPPALDAGGA
ncbi:MAG TPA: cytochrome c oxidase subunit II [Solirubrobacterales bacterium]|nr:cytochrome c oxidase subunit II [Solirubrobacterales bacterium]